MLSFATGHSPLFWDAAQCVFVCYVIYTCVAVLYQIYKNEPKASGCISDTTQPLMLYIAYDTPTSKCSCFSTILKIKAILAK